MVPLDYSQTSLVAVKDADRCFCQGKKKKRKKKKNQRKKKKRNLFPCVEAKTGNTEYVQIETQRVKFGSMLLLNLLLHFIPSLSTGFLRVKADECCSTCEERRLSKECMCPNHNQRIYNKKLFFSSDKSALTAIFPCPCFFHAKYYL